MVTEVAQHVSTFWPDLTRVTSATAAIGGIVASITTLLNRRNIQRVHVLINGELHGKVAKLEQAADRLTAASDHVTALQAQSVPGGQRSTDAPT